MDTDVLLEVPIGISNRHVHLSQKDLDQLFGKNYKLTWWKDLSQPGQYACTEVVSIVGPKGTIENVKILGPLRKSTQIEVSRTDSFTLGIKAPIRDSGDFIGTPGCVLVGPKGEVSLQSGVMVAARHIHMAPATASQHGIHDKDQVSVAIDGERAMIFQNVLVRVRKDFALELHLDIDEANAAWVNNGDKGNVLKKSHNLCFVG